MRGDNHLETVVPFQYPEDCMSQLSHCISHLLHLKFANETLYIVQHNIPRKLISKTVSFKHIKWNEELQVTTQLSLAVAL